jgi:hypothetical protein
MATPMSPMMLKPSELDKKSNPNLSLDTKTQGVNSFDYIMEEHLKLFDTLGDKIVEEKATDLSTLIDAFSNFVIEQLRSMPEEVKAANQVETHITDFNELREDKNVTVDQTNLPFSNLTPEELKLFDPLITLFVDAMKDQVKETKVGGAKTKKARKKSKRRRTSKRRRSAGAPGNEMVFRGPNGRTRGGNREKLIFSLMIALMVIGWVYMYNFLKSFYDRDYGGNIDMIRESFRSDQTLYQRLLTWVMGIGGQDASYAFFTIDTIFYSITTMSGGRLPLPVHQRNLPSPIISSWLSNASSATSIYHIKFMFIDIILFLLYVIGFIQYQARLLISTTPNQRQVVKQDWRIIQKQIIAIKSLLTACGIVVWYAAFTATTSLARVHDLMATPPAFANPPTITGIDPGQGQGPTLLVNALLTFSSAGITRIGNVLQLGNGSGRGGIPLQLGDGSGSGDGGGYDGDGGGYDGDGGGYDDDDDDGYRRPIPSAHLRSAVRKHWMERNEKNP